MKSFFLSSISPRRKAMSASSIRIACGVRRLARPRAAWPSVDLYSSRRVSSNRVPYASETRRKIFSTSVRSDSRPIETQAVGMVALGGDEVGLLDLVLGRRLRQLEHLEQVLRLDDAGLGRELLAHAVDVGRALVEAGDARRRRHPHALRRGVRRRRELERPRRHLVHARRRRRACWATAAAASSATACDARPNPRMAFIDSADAGLTLGGSGVSRPLAQPRHLVGAD